jgi:hypothetical protein
MKEINKKIFHITMYSIICIILIYYGNVLIGGYQNFEDRMYNDFQSFGLELEALNNELSKILILKGYNFNKEKVFINKNIVWNFHLSSYAAKNMDNNSSDKDYLYDWLYYDVNNVIQNILYDGIITTSEEKYLKNLYNYTDQLIKEYRIIINDTRYPWDFESILTLKKRIVNIYNNYSQKSESLLNSKQYAFLKEYKGDFKDIGLKKAKIYCTEVFSTLIKNQTLKYYKKDDMNKEYIFKSYKKLNTNDPITVNNDQPNIDYEISYNERTNTILVKPIHIKLLNDTKYTEKQLDHIATNTLNKFNKKIYHYDKNKKYDKKGNLLYVEYSYKKNNNDASDTIQKIKMEIQVNGCINQFEITYLNKKNIAIKPITPISESEILSKIKQESVIHSFNIRENIQGNTEYIVYIKYRDNLYKAVFDGKDGTLISYDIDRPANKSQ